MRARWVFHELTPELPGVGMATVASWWPGKCWLVSTVQLDESSVRNPGSAEVFPSVEFIQPKVVYDFSNALDTRADIVDVKVRVPIGTAVPRPGKFITQIFRCERLKGDRSGFARSDELPLFEREYSSLSEARAGHRETVDMLARGKLKFHTTQHDRQVSELKLPTPAPKLPRMHHYNFAYKALPGLAFADPHVPLGFGNDIPKGSLAKFWNRVGSKLPVNERVSEAGLQGTGGPFGENYSIVLITMPKPEQETEAYYIAIVYPRSWFNSPDYENSKLPNPYPVFFLLTMSEVPGRGGVSGAMLRVLTKEGHGAVAFGVSVSERAFLGEIEKIMGKEAQFITWVHSKPWNYFMQDGETGETFGAD